MQKTRLQLFMSMMTNPVLLLVYFLFWKELYELCMYGGTGRRLPVLIACGSFFLVWLIVFLVRAHKLSGQKAGKTEDIWPDKGRNVKQTALLYWKIAAAVILLSCTIYYVRGIIHSATGYNGKLAWYLEDLKHKKEVELVHDNIYVDGLEGIFSDLREELDIPDARKLYITNSFRLEFSEDGSIETIETSLYGRGKEEHKGAWLISYNRSQSRKMTVYCGGAVVKSDETREIRAVEPLIEVLERISLEKETEEWKADGERRFGILYYGIRSWDPGENGIYFVNPAGEKADAGKIESLTGQELDHVVNYTVSLYLPETEEGTFIGDKPYVPARLIPLEDFSQAGISNEQAKALWKKEYPEEAKEQELASGNVTSENVDVNVSKQLDNGNIVYFLDDKTGYELEVVDAALGSRFYALNKTTDGGKTWNLRNPNPYQNGSGAGSEMKFIDENLGFISLSHSGGTEAELFRTKDGGVTFTKITFPDIQVPLGDGTYNPFDYPGMPYEENGKLFVKVGQGDDGDYHSGAKALYESQDRGNTWVYVEETE